MKTLSLALLLLAAQLLQADTPIEARMSAEIRQATGLDKLSAEELRALNRWLLEHYREAVAVEADFGLVKQSEDPLEAIESIVEKVQESAHGRLILTLENGQVWRQQQSKRLLIKPGDAVMIRKSIFNSYDLKHLPSGLLTKVRRVD